MSVIFFAPLSASMVHAQAFPALTADLKLGSSGSQVLVLEKILNKDPETQLALAGPGSPGYETSYFGSKTQNAVIRFQQKYKTEVLTPAGLLASTGYVGALTRAKLNQLAGESSKNPAQNPVPTSTTPPVVTPAPVSTLPTPHTPLAATTTQNPNFEHFDQVILDVDRVSKKQGYSDTQLNAIHTEIIKALSTTTDLKAAFVKTVQKNQTLAELEKQKGQGFLARIETVLKTVFLPRHALAGTGFPFGGAILSTFFCTNSATWYIILEPLPPTYAVALTYVPESQLYFSHTLPFSTYALGAYVEPGVCVEGACPFCTYIPSEGLISPQTGSAL